MSCLPWFLLVQECCLQELQLAADVAVEAPCLRVSAREAAWSKDRLGSYSRTCVVMALGFHCRARVLVGGGVVGRGNRLARRGIAGCSSERSVRVLAVAFYLRSSTRRLFSSTTLRCPVSARNAFYKGSIRYAADNFARRGRRKFSFQWHTGLLNA